MYYVIYVGAGKETYAEQYIRKTVPDECYINCFHPTRHMKKKFHGEWIEVYERLIPGYIFIESKNILQFYQEIRRIPMLLKLLGKEEPDASGDVRGFYPLTDTEEVWIQKISGIRPGTTVGDANPVAELSSVGFDENDQVVILDGPLADMRGQVRKINLHKRIAEVEVEFMGNTTVLHLGIELIQKDIE